MRIIEAEAGISKDDWTGIRERSERKKIQNRLNQRALRERKKKTGEIQIVPGRKPFHVSRWRIDQPATTQPVQPSSRILESSNSSSPEAPCNSSTTTTPQNALPGQEPENLMALVEHSDFSPQTSYPTPPLCDEFPLSSDHLIQLIHQNVFTALMKNKYLLAKTTYLTHFNLHEPSLVLLPSRDFCDGLTVIHPLVDTPLPPSLHPTALQTSIPHASWLNIFPFPRFRDNLIAHEPIFDAAELLYDLYGHMGRGNGRFSDPKNSSIQNEDEDDLHVGRRGLIVWGEPWDNESWEITPGFLGKWAWLLKGCEDLIAVSNRWRAMRNETPL